jgi:hypothetical protein
MRTSHACWLIPIFNRQSLFHFYSIQEIDNVRNMKYGVTLRGQKGSTASPPVVAACGGGLCRRAAEGNVQNAKGAAEKVHVPSAGGGS